MLILPDPTERTTDSGLLVVEHWPMEVSGKVVAVGASKHPRKAESFAMAAVMDEWADMGTHARVQVLAGMYCRLLQLTGRRAANLRGDRRSGASA